MNPHSQSNSACGGQIKRGCCSVGACWFRGAAGRLPRARRDRRIEGRQGVTAAKGLWTGPDSTDTVTCGSNASMLCSATSRWRKAFQLFSFLRQRSSFGFGKTAVVQTLSQLLASADLLFESESV